MAEPYPVGCPYCDFCSGQRGMDTRAKCAGAGRISIYSHDYACTLSDGTPYRLAIRRGAADREVHVEDAERIASKLHADDDLANRNWLVAFMLPSAADWVVRDDVAATDGDEGGEIPGEPR